MLVCACALFLCSILMKYVHTQIRLLSTNKVEESLWARPHPLKASCRWTSRSQANKISKLSCRPHRQKHSNPKIVAKSKGALSNQGLAPACQRITSWNCAFCKAYLGSRSQDNNSATIGPGTSCAKRPPKASPISTGSCCKQVRSGAATAAAQVKVGSTNIWMSCRRRACEDDPRQIGCSQWMPSFASKFLSLVVSGEPSQKIAPRSTSSE